MDPNANLEEQLRLAKLLVDNDYTDAAHYIDAVRLAELVLALDDWIRSGGFLPTRWQPSTTGARCGAVCPTHASWVCSRCAGHTGRHESYNGGDWHDEREPCDACNGTGFVHGSCCRRCEGSMSLPKKRGR